MVLKDGSGYDVVDYGKPPRRDVPVLGKYGTYIRGRGGKRHFVTYSGHKHPDLWLEIRKIRKATDLAAFMSQYGPLGRWDLSGWPYDEPYSLMVPLVKDLQRLANLTQDQEETGFFQAVNGKGLIEITVNGRLSLAPTVTTLGRFMVFQMMQTFEDERIGSSSIRICANATCGKLWRPSRPDAIYCGSACRSSAHMRRKRKKTRERMSGALAG